MIENIKTDICILGGGSGGLVLAAAARSFGVKTILIENRKMGGECLNYGCIPSKSLIAAADIGHTLKAAEKYGFSFSDVLTNYEKIHQYIQSVIQRISSRDSKERFESLGVKVLTGNSKFIGPNRLIFNHELSIKAKHFVIATGSSPAIPDVEGLKNVPFLTNETIFNLKEKVDHLVVMGGGPVGCELAQAYCFLGSKVTIIQHSYLLPKDDPSHVEELKNIFIKQGINIYEESTVQAVTKKDTAIEVTFQKDGNNHVVNASHLLIATGRQPNINGLALEKANVQCEKSGVIVNKRLRTSNKRIYAIGDVINGPKFTHIAAYQANIVLQNILFKLHKSVDNRALPWVTYTTPQLAHVGLTEKQAAKINGEKRIIVKRFQDNDRAQSENKTAGGIKLIATGQGQVLGVSILGDNVDNLIGLWSLVITQRLSLGKVAKLIIPYPTREEINKASAIEFYRPMLSSRWLRWLVRCLQWF